MEVLHYNLDMTPESEWKIVSAGAFARDNLLYLQEAGHFISGANYYTCLLYTSPSPRDS